MWGKPKSCENCKSADKEGCEQPCFSCDWDRPNFELREGYSFADGIRETKGMSKSE